MAKATYNGTVLAESDKFEFVEGNIYFPPETVKTDFFEDSARRTNCPWKGEAKYYNIVVDGETLQDAAWYYPDTKKAAENIRDHVAFYTSKIQVER